ncbi:hypothetical protein PC9H_003056 [Pleurotus ostreatus]|uniref:DH domain-containing protein n=1 Tax=Pleurotus ostreatus TaxID=5322 RepID=A0A8H7A079_PLEOS|nr:uncharacterized protein PC9H_003056 [Pleurotus ostreatus]KAF7436227.1 hypothetical protein PC9H_003056 [Pleurotus ostreatus]
MVGYPENLPLPELWSPSSSLPSSNDSFYSASSNEPLVAGSLGLPAGQAEGIYFPSFRKEDATSARLLSLLDEQSSDSCVSSSSDSSNVNRILLPAGSQARQRRLSGIVLSTSNMLWNRGRTKSLPSLSPSDVPFATFPIAAAPRNDATSGAHRNRSVKFHTTALSQKIDRGTLDRIPSPHPQYRCHAISTDTLASLAWTGHSSNSISPSLHPDSSNTASFLLPLQCSSISPTCDAPPTVPLTPSPDAAHRHSSQDTAKKRLRRWTLAAAMTDSSITDEVFVEGLEKVRMAAEIWEWRESASVTSSIPQLPVLPQRSPIGDIPVGDGNSDHGEEELVSTQRRRSQPKLPIRSTSDPSSAQTWQMARRALLICREIVRTERNYLASLHILVDGGTITTPPAPMLTLLQPLVQISTAILKKMERNPSALGVAEAFVSCQEDLESALVAWCSSVGDFFGPSKSTSKTLGTIVGPLKRKFNVWKRVKAAGLDWDTSLQRKAHITIGDLAILPTQRILRYVLLYKGTFASVYTLLQYYDTKQIYLDRPITALLHIPGLGLQRKRLKELLGNVTLRSSIDYLLDEKMRK